MSIRKVSFPKTLAMAAAAAILGVGLSAVAEARDATYQIYRYSGNDFIVRKTSHGSQVHLHAYRAAGTQWERYAVSSSANGQSFPARILRHGRRIGRVTVDLDLYTSIDLNGHNNPP